MDSRAVEPPDSMNERFVAVGGAVENIFVERLRRKPRVLQRAQQREERARDDVGLLVGIDVIDAEIIVEAVEQAVLAQHHRELAGKIREQIARAAEVLMERAQRGGAGFVLVEEGADGGGEIAARKEHRLLGLHEPLLEEEQNEAAAVHRLPLRQVLGGEAGERAAVAAANAFDAGAGDFSEGKRNAQPASAKRRRS